MTTSILVTKLFIPPIRPELVPRLRLIKRLSESLHCKLTLISAPAGFGKTTLASEWVADCERPAAWLSLDKADNNPSRFLIYLIAALQTIRPNIGEGVLGVLQSPQQPPAESVLPSLINELAAIPVKIVLILDDYHLVEAQPIHDALTFLLEHLPPQLHLVIATREDPHLPLSRLRARGQLTELRAADLRFTFSEAAEFLNQVMRLNLLEKDIKVLETRTEGWIAGLQLAAISMQGRDDATNFIKSFTGSHRLVLDYLIEEVLEQQTKSVQNFLLQTAILNQLTGSLCDAVRFGSAKIPSGQENGQAILEMLDRANLFIVPLDNERRWYRYHHLFADLLRQRLHQSASTSTGDDGRSVDEYHIRASIWCENNGLEFEAFHHAAAANDVERAARLMEGDGLPLPFRGDGAAVLKWLESLPTTVLDAWPLLLVTYASGLLAAGKTNGVEQKLQDAEAALAASAALQDAEPDEKTQDLIGRIAATRASLAVGQHQAATIIAQSRRALEVLHPNNLGFRTATTWKLGYAYHLQGDRAAARRAYTEAISICQASGNIFINILASTGLGNVQEAENQLYLAAETYRRVLQLADDQPLPVTCEAHLGLARINYEWNDLDAAQQHGQQSLQLARHIESNDRFAACGVFLARLKLAQGDVSGAAELLAQANQFVRQHNFVHRMPEVAAAQVLTLLYQHNLAAAAHLAQTHELPISQARVYLAQGDTSAALAVLEPVRRQVEAKGWEDEQLKVLVLLAVVMQEHNEKEQSAQTLGEALVLAEPGGFIRIFVDEGPPMARLLHEVLPRAEAQTRGIAPDYVGRLLAAFPDTKPVIADSSQRQAINSELVEPLSERELEVLELIAEGLTNTEIAARLYLSLNTVKVHTRNIYGKLNVHSRTQAIAHSQELGLLPRKPV